MTLETEMYDRDGKVIDLVTWSELHSNMDYRVVEQTVIGEYLVSTVWLGIDHSYGDGPIKIFETMIFKNDDMDDLYCERYTTDLEAVTGHARAMEYAKGLNDGNEEEPRHAI